jgi:putative ABC transport system permease protein
MNALRLATRQIKRNPAFAAIVVLTFALGVGASTLIFSIINGVLLVPLPYPAPDGIVQVFQVGANGANRTHPSDPNFADLKAQTRSFSAFTQFNALTQTVGGGSEPLLASVGYASREFYEILGVQPALGRLFAAEEEREGGALAALISHRYWQRYLGGTPDFASRSLRIGERTFSIVGVLPDGFDFPGHADVWLPREIVPVVPQRTSHNWQVLARLAPGVSLAQARQDASAIARRLRQEYGDDTWMIDAAVVPLQDLVVGNLRPALYVLGAAVLLLFLVACVNIVSMLLARAVSREQELAVRVALGAGRWRLAAQFLAESSALCGAGGIVGLVLAWWGLAVLGATYGGTLPRVATASIDWPTVAFAATLSLLAAVTLSVLLARRATRADASLAGSRRGIVGARRAFGRDSLVAVQVAMALVLIVGAVLLGRSFQQLVRSDPGYRTDELMLMSLTLPRPAENADAAPLARFYEELMDRLAALPGAQAVGGVTFAPLSGWSGPNGTLLTLSQPDEIKTTEELGELAKDPSRTTLAEFRVASEGYFAALDIPLLRGRMFERGDGPGAEHVALISRSLAEVKWPGEDPIGKLLQFGNMDGDLTPFRVIGVVGDVREALDADPRPTFYGYYAQRPRSTSWSFWIAVRGDNPASFAPAARAIVRAMNPDLPPGIQMSEEMLSTSLAPRRFNLVLVGVFGASALLLAVAGIYGAIAFNVAQRTREIGVRIALGALDRSVVAMVLRKALRLVGAGVVAGTLVALGASRVAGSLLYGVSPNDPIAFAAAIGLLSLAAVAAAFVPARRAARVDPMVALRQE